MLKKIRVFFDGNINNHRLANIAVISLLPVDGGYKVTLRISGKVKRTIASDLPAIDSWLMEALSSKIQEDTVILVPRSN